MDDDGRHADSAAEDDAAAAIRGIERGQLSAAFRESLWDEIASELGQEAAPLGRRPTEPKIWRRFGIVAAAMLVFVSIAVAFLVRSTHDVGRITSPSVDVGESVGSTSTQSDSTITSAGPTTAFETDGVATSVTTAAGASTTTVPMMTTTTNATAVTLSPLPAATDLPADGPLPAIPGSLIESARMIDATTGWVVSDKVIAHTDDSGTTWRTQPLQPLFIADGPYDPGRDFVLDRDHAWVARAALSGSDVTVTRTSDGAASTQTTTIDPGFKLGVPTGLVFVNAHIGFVSIGDPSADATWESGQGVLFRTTDGGATFQRLADVAPAPLAFDTPDIGWGGVSRLWRTSDGAATWDPVPLPGFEEPSPGSEGPRYTFTIIATSPARTVVKGYAAYGLGGQVRYLATDDQGATWTDVAPPETREVNNTGPQSTLTVVNASELFGIQQAFGPSTLWHSGDGGRSYQARGLPFNALSITMATPSIGWVTTTNQIRATHDGGATWTTIADVIAPATLKDGCTWQPSFAGHDGAGQREYVLISLTNTSSVICAPPSFTEVSAYSVETAASVQATQGATDFPLPASPASVRPGATVVLQIAVLDPLEDCGNPPSQLVDEVIVTISDAKGASPHSALVPMPFPLQTACAFNFALGGTG
ncbi:MAG: hypothetical protein JWR83_2169 [Aeromicrobium sp.]|nr:hypothetical protein [Aeromicrobium sp.]